MSSVTSIDTYCMGVNGGNLCYMVDFLMLTNLPAYSSE
jgi:exo-beta-1,3-glucanase (GH17 family)